MKKKIFPVLLSVLALTGCDFLSNIIPDSLNPFKKDEDQQQTPGEEQGHEEEHEQEEHGQEQEEEDEKSLYSIKVTTLPKKTNYLVGELFDPTGMVVIAKYTDKSQETITNYTYSTAVFSAAGTIQFDISYQGKTDTITLYVKEAREEVEDEYTETIMTSGASFAGSFNNGYHFDTEAHKVELANYFDDQVEYEYLISKVETSNLHSQKFKSETYLQLGSGSNAEGLIKWVSIEKIYKVEINVMCYAKEDTYHGITNIDNWSHIAIDAQDFDLTYDGGTDPEVKTFSLEYPQGTTEFTVKSSMGRVFMKSMSITWRG